MLVETTNFDDRGLVSTEVVPEAVTAGSFAGYVVPAGNQPWQNRTRHVYDAFGRETRSEWYQGLTLIKANTSDYGLTTVAMTSPNGVTVTNTVDAAMSTVTHVNAIDVRANTCVLGRRAHHRRVARPIAQPSASHVVNAAAHVHR